MSGKQSKQSKKLVRRNNSNNNRAPRPKPNRVVTLVPTNLGKRKRHPLGASANIAEWVDRLLSPGDMPAVPRPRPFSDTRVAIATQRSFLTLAQGTLVGNVSAVQAATPYNIVSNYIAIPVLNADTALGSMTSGLPPAIVSIPSASIFDCNLQSLSIRIKCLQPPLTAQGSILIGLTPTNALNAINLATYNSLRVQPGFIEVPVTELMRQGSITIAGTKASPAADEFLSTVADTQDYNTPIVLCTGMTPSSVLQVEVVANYDVRLTVNNATGLYPGRNITDNSVSAINAYQGAVDYIGHLPSTSYFETSSYMTHIMDALSTAVPSMVGFGTLAYAGHAARRHVNQLNNQLGALRV